MLAVFNIITFAVSGHGWGVTGVFSYWGAWIAKPIVNLTTWANLNVDTFNLGFFQSSVSVRNLGIILGALVAVLLASQFKIKKIKSWRQVIAAVVGGLMMGYGARVAMGCNIGALFSASPRCRLPAGFSHCSCSSALGSVVNYSSSSSCRRF
ncbi:MAG: YeeE/YedE family protein [Bacillus subtilis]|nr:YeeE/YedE family protein [Bacillus subtilis]